MFKLNPWSIVLFIMFILFSNTAKAPILPVSRDVLSNRMFYACFVSMIDPPSPRIAENIELIPIGNAYSENYSDLSIFNLRNIYRVSNLTIRHINCFSWQNSASLCVNISETPPLC